MYYLAYSGNQRLKTCCTTSQVKLPAGILTIEGICYTNYMSYTKQQRSEYSKRSREAAKNAFLMSRGNKCVKCGSSERLEIDHIDRTKREYCVSQHWQRPKILAIELPKCQLLCHTCHLKKTKTERFLARKHSLGTYRLGCRCDRCKTAKSIARRKYYLEHREAEIARQKIYDLTYIRKQ